MSIDCREWVKKDIIGQKPGKEGMAPDMDLLSWDWRIMQYIPFLSFHMINECL